MRSFFISSTFKDMQVERDILHQDIFPSLRRRLKEYGEDVQELDLRWGVDTSLMTEEESGMHVIESCIDAIDRCRPYMVILIGERYGWIPERNLIEQTHDARLDAWYREEISITQMEILYGVLAEDELDHCVFCFRDPGFMKEMPETMREVYEPESDRHRRMLEAFKRKIRSNPKARILEYSPSWNEESGRVCAMESFRRQLEEILWNMIRAELPEKVLGEAAKILQDARLTCAEYMGSYVPRFKEHEDAAYILTGRSGVWITGQAGIGKSAYMSSIAMAAAKTGAHVFLYFCGNENCGSKTALLGAFLQWLLKEFPEYAPDISEADGLSDEKKIWHIRRLLEQKRVCDRAILIDGADQMEEDISELLLSVLSSIRREKEKGHTFAVAVSSAPEYFEERKAALRGAFSQGTMKPFSSAEVNAFVQMHAARRGKRVDAKVVHQIRKKAGSSNPYYLSLVMQKLFMMSREEFAQAERLAPGMEGLSCYMQGQVKEMPDNLSELTVSMLKEAVQKLGVSSAGNDARKVTVTMLKVLAVSGGLRLSELERIMELLGLRLLPMNIERFFSYLYDSFGEDREGRWNFKHRLIKESVLKEMTSAEMKNIARAVSIQKTEEGKAAQGFAYAVQAGECELVKQNLSALSENFTRWEKECFYECRRVLERCTEAPFENFASVAEADTDGYVETLARTIIFGREEVLRNRSLWNRLYDIISELKVVSKKAYFYQKLAGNEFYSYSLDKNMYERQWRETADAYRALVCPERDETEAFYAHLLRTLPLNEADPLWDAIGECMSLVEQSLLETGLPPEKYGIHLASQIPAFYRKIQRADGERRQAIMKEYRVFLAEAEPPVGWISSALRGQQVALTLMFRDEKNTQEAFTLAKEILPWYQERMFQMPALRERYQFACLLECLGSVVKEESSLKYREAELAVWKKLCTDYRFDVFEDFCAYCSYCMGKFLEKKEKSAGKGYGGEHAGQISACYARAVQIYDRMLHVIPRKDPSFRWILESSLAARYARVCRRMEGDMWTWKDERIEMFAADSIYPCETPEYFRGQMGEDLGILEKENIWLNRERDKTAGENQLGLVYEKGAAYYDMAQEETKALQWCEKLMEHLQKITGEISSPRQWNTALRFLTAARIFRRWGRYDRGDEAAQRCEKLIFSMNESWVEKKGYSRRLSLAKAELYLVKAASGLGRGDLKKAMFFVSLAEEQLEEDEKLLDDEKYIRSEIACVRGRIFCAAGEEERAAEALKSAAGYWPRGALFRTSFANEEEVQRQFGFLVSQELRGRIMCDKTLLDQIAEGYAAILNNCTEKRDASRRPLLLRQARELSDYYREKNFSLPEPLEDILLITEKEREERRISRFEKAQEQIKLDMDAPAKEFKKRAQEKMNLLFEEWKILKKYPERKEELQENFLRRIRLMDQCAEKYREDGDWAREEYMERQAVIMCRFACSQIPGMISSQELWERYRPLSEKRNLRLNEDRSTQTEWMEVMDCCFEICLEAFRETRNARWAERLTEEVGYYRSFLENSRKSDPGQTELLKEYELQTYVYVRRMYLEMGKSGEYTAQGWIVPYLKSVGSQLKKTAVKRGSFYQESLEELYDVQDFCGQDSQYDEYADDIQELIETYSQELAGADYELHYYMQRAVRELGEKADVSEAAGYVEKLRKQAQNAVLAVN